MTTFTARELCSECERELIYRRRVYARLIAQGKMRQEAADRHIAMMKAIRDRYNEEATAEERRGELKL